MKKQKESQPFKKRIDIVFGESDRDIWEWLEQQDEMKATLIKKTLRNLMNENLLNKDEIQSMIREEVHNVIKNLNLQAKTDEVVDEQGSEDIEEVEEIKPKLAAFGFKAREF